MLLFLCVYFSLSAYYCAGEEGDVGYSLKIGHAIDVFAKYDSQSSSSAFMSELQYLLKGPLSLQHSRQHMQVHVAQRICPGRDKLHGTTDTTGILLFLVLVIELSKNDLHTYKHVKYSGMDISHTLLLKVKENLFLVFFFSHLFLSF